MKGYWGRGGMEKYAFRNQILRTLGYAEPVYKNYLKSEEWKKIRSEVLAMWPKCVVCQGIATQVHHMTYDIGTMLGLHYSNLAAVCNVCHEECEFTEGEKNDVNTARKQVDVAATEHEYGRTWLAYRSKEWSMKCQAGLGKKIKAIEREIRELTNCRDEKKAEILRRKYSADA